MSHVRSEFRYSERIVKHIQESTLNKMGVIPGQFASIKMWHGGSYYGSTGKDARWLVAKEELTG